MKIPKKSASVFLAIILAVFFLAGFYFFQTKPASGQKYVSIHGKRIKIETVSTPEGMRLGLGKRESLCLDCGMLFVFEEKNKTPFWMKDMLFDLDIIWIDGGKIVWIKKNVDHTSLETITPLVSADKVLEVNAGFCEKYGILPGDRVEN